jgi:hypothetical protein
VSSIYVIEDERHSERLGEYPALSGAVAELERLKSVPWDAAPNQAPCQNWRECGRLYEIVEYDTSDRPWKEVRRIPALEITRTVVQWLEQLPGAKNDA